MINPVTELRQFFRAALVDPVDRNHLESPEALVKRRWISSVVLAMGAFVLAWTLRLPPGDSTFYTATLVLATIWIVGSLLSGRVYLGEAHTRSGRRAGHGVLQAVAIGITLLAVFLAGAVLVAPVPLLRDPVLAVLEHLRLGSLPVVAALAVLLSVGEELFFRGALYSAVAGRQAPLVTTLVYALTTIPTGVPLLVLAATLLGLVAGLQRRVTGGVLAPIITHLTLLLGLALLVPQLLGAFGLAR